MPNGTEDNGGAGGDDAAVKAAADKAAADAAAAAGNGEETVTMKKSDLKKIEDDRDNYKRMGLQKKADERNLGGGDGGAGGGTTFDEKKVNEVATAATTKVLRDAGEKNAKREFLSAHSEYVDDAQWSSLMSHYYSKGGEVTKEEIRDRMEAALFEHKRATGKLDEHLKAEADRARQQGRAEGQAGFGANAGGAGDHQGGGQATGNESAVAMASRFSKTDPKKVAKIDVTKDNEIVTI